MSDWKQVKVCLARVIVFVTLGMEQKNGRMEEWKNLNIIDCLMPVILKKSTELKFYIWRPNLYQWAWLLLAVSSHTNQ